MTLDFTDRVPECEPGDRLVLFLNGWIEYGYSNTFFAAWQALVDRDCYGARANAPLAHRGEQGLVLRHTLAPFLHLHYRLQLELADRQIVRRVRSRLRT